MARSRSDFTPAERCIVRNALAAVGLAQPDLNCDGTVDGGSGDADGDQVIDAADTCPNVANPMQTDTDRDALGDVCDADDDNDGRLDGLDNCPLAANAVQGDADRDGRGDACDDDDNDGFPDAFDNCPQLINDQTDSDRDGLGDPCDVDDDNDRVTDPLRQLPAGVQPEPGQRRPGPARRRLRQLRRRAQPDAARRRPRRSRRRMRRRHRRRRPAQRQRNCPRVPNPDQLDTDNDGIGIACDTGEQRRFYGSTDAEFLRSLVRRAERDIPVRIPIEPCWADGCPGWLPPDFVAEVDVRLPFAADVRIVDDRGFVQARKDQTAEGTLRFPVGADLRYQPAAGPVYRGRQYFLEILAGPEAGRGFPMDTRVRSGQLD